MGTIAEITQMAKLFTLLLVACLSLCSAFTATGPRVRLPSSTAQRAVCPITMGNNAPIVPTAKSVMGDKQFNKLRGKGISLHSDAIGTFSDWAGVPRQLRQSLIKKAKTNGGLLGFLN